MSQQTLNLGTNPNDGTGDNLRAAGSKINANFSELYRKVVAVTFASTITLNSATTDVANIAALTGNLTLANPSGSPGDGQKLTVRFAQDATGSRTLTFGTAFAVPDSIASAIPSAANAQFEMLFQYHAGTSKWRALAVSPGF